MYKQRCSRCGKELSDYASMESGVGPVCRHRNNHLYAKLITANPAMASVFFLQDDLAEGVPAECFERFSETKKTFLDKCAKASKANREHGGDAFSLKGTDFRKEIESLDYILSFPVSRETKTIIIKIVRHLGYVGLAAVLSGKACKSPAKVYFKNGRVYLEGKSCKTGWRKMRAISGISFPRYRGDKSPFSAPAEKTKVFLDIVKEHWPLYEDNLVEVQKAAARWKKANPKKPRSGLEERAIVESASVGSANIVLRTKDFTFTFIWDKNVNIREMLEEIKKVPKSERKYNPKTKEWIFLTKHLGYVQKTARKYFPDLVIAHGAVSETPDGLWAKTASSKNTSFGRRPSRKLHPHWRQGNSNT